MRTREWLLENAKTHVEVDIFVRKGGDLRHCQVRFYDECDCALISGYDSLGQIVKDSIVHRFQMQLKEAAVRAVWRRIHKAKSTPKRNRDPKTSNLKGPVFNKLEYPSVLCYACKERKSEIHLTQIRGDKFEKFELCKECAKAKGIDTNGFYLADLLLGLGTDKTPQP